MSTRTAVKPSLTLKRRINASPARVFSAWTDPEKLKRWMEPGEVRLQLAEANPHVGGRYRLVMKVPDGNQPDVSGSTAKSFRTKSWSSPGRGIRRPSRNRS